MDTVELISEDRSGTAEFSFPDMKYRYVLSRTWDASKKSVLWIMLNPSTADQNVFDPTVRRCFGFSQDWGFGRMVVCNIFAYRSTDPEMLLLVPDPVGPLNNEKIEEEIEKSQLVMVAWGAHKIVRTTNRHREVMDLIHRHGYVPHTLKLTNSGYPSHPLYIPKDSPRIPLFKHTPTVNGPVLLKTMDDPSCTVFELEDKK